MLLNANKRKHLRLSRVEVPDGEATVEEEYKTSYMKEIQQRNNEMGIYYKPRTTLPFSNLNRLATAINGVNDKIISNIQEEEIENENILKSNKRARNKYSIGDAIIPFEETVALQGFRKNSNGKDLTFNLNTNNDRLFKNKNSSPNNINPLGFQFVPKSRMYYNDDDNYDSRGYQTLGEEIFEENVPTMFLSVLSTTSLLLLTFAWFRAAEQIFDYTSMKLFGVGSKLSESPIITALITTILIVLIHEVVRARSRRHHNILLQNYASINSMLQRG